MSHSYASEYPPGVQVDEGIKAFFEEFYKTSDTPDAHDKYADSFTDGAVLVMASKRVQGRDEILELRKGLWTAVASRLHTAVKIFPFGAASTEVMLYGTVAYTLKDGRKAAVGLVFPRGERRVGEERLCGNGR
ncbi:hypothetical protein D0Z07_6239 [Hyphodiscus hymeniophilus]|uniref:Uncharacterized protein n=1 Tax=Hyphodiscus hymeniophilus TaxID=353542 RepID=A0A9P6VF62_9HELO|nr:hypothetical protein D0Z07_6239 [Hyphodiscus hymeniophilus]